MVKIWWSWLAPFLPGPPVWQTDGQTDRWTELRWLRRAIAVPAVARKNWNREKSHKAVRVSVKSVRWISANYYRLQITTITTIIQQYSHLTYAGLKTPANNIYAQHRMYYNISVNILPNSFPRSPCESGVPPLPKLWYIKCSTNQHINHFQKYSITSYYTDPTFTETFHKLSAINFIKKCNQCIKYQYLHLSPKNRTPITFFK